jgi:hypothetical protein
MTDEDESLCSLDEFIDALICRLGLQPNKHMVVANDNTTPHQAALRNLPPPPTYPLLDWAPWLLRPWWPISKLK